MANLRVVVLGWGEEIRPWVSALRQNGFSVPVVAEPKGEIMKEVQLAEADIIVVDLTQRTSHGREMAEALARSGTTKGLPIVVVTPDGAGVRSLESKIGDLIVTAPSKLVGAVRQASKVRS